MAPFFRAAQIQTPGGKTLSTGATRSVTLGTPSDPFSVTSATWSTTVNDKTAQTTYDGTTRRFTTTSPVGRQRTLDIDSLGRPIRSQFASFAAAVATWDSRSRLETVTVGSGADARTWTLGYNTKNELVSVTDPLQRTTSFAHDFAGRVTRQTLPDTREILAGYDAMGNATSITPPDRPAHGFTFSPVQQETRYSPPPVTGSGNTVTDYSYNDDRQLTLVTRPDAATITPAWNATTGKLGSLTHAADTITPGYSSTTGKLTSLTSANGPDLAFTYDGFLPLSETWSGSVAGSVSRTWDDNFRVASESVNGANTVSVTYDDDSLPTAVGALSLTRSSTTGLIESTTLGQVTTSRTYNAFGEVATETLTAAGNTLYAVSFTRDKLGRILTKEETIQGVTTTWEYTYDPTGRLEIVKKNGAAFSSSVFDDNSNRTSYTKEGVTSGATFDDQDRLLTHGATSCTWTANGELASRTDASGTTNYQYDALGNLRQATLPSGTILDYVIDARNRRVGKKVNGVLTQAWLYRDQLEPVAELDGAGNLVARFVYATKPHSPDYIVKGGVTYRVLTDHLGSPRLVINTATGAIAQRMDFDEWGNVTLDTAPGFQPFGFAGGLLDAHTGLTRFGARDYDPRVGRWTAKEPLRFAGSLNFYAYASNDPVNRIDPNGLIVITDGSAMENAYRDAHSDPLTAELAERFENDPDVTVVLFFANLGALDPTESLKGLTNRHVVDLSYYEGGGCTPRRKITKYHRVYLIGIDAKTVARDGTPISATVSHELFHVGGYEAGLPSGEYQATEQTRRFLNDWGITPNIDNPYSPTR